MKKLFVLFLCLCVGDSFASGIASNSETAPCTNNTLETYSGNSNLSADWQPNTINISWYNENEKLTVQQSAQSCVYDGTLSVPATPPTRTGYTFAGWTIRLPGAYTELEYIESTGTQWIETPYGMNAQTEQDNGVFDFDLDIQFTNTSQRVVLGYAVNSSTYWDIPAGSTKYAQGGITGNYSVFDRHILSVHTVVDVNADKKIFNTSKVIINGQVVGTGTNYRSTLVAGGKFRTTQHDSYITYPIYAKIYGLIQYQFGTKVFHGVPARRNSDNVLGMYDIVSQTFFTNRGSGTFIGGPVVQ